MVSKSWMRVWVKIHGGTALGLARPGITRERTHQLRGTDSTGGDHIVRLTGKGEVVAHKHGGTSDQPSRKPLVVRVLQPEHVMSNRPAPGHWDGPALIKYGEPICTSVFSDFHRG